MLTITVQNLGSFKNTLKNCCIIVCICSLITACSGGVPSGVMDPPKMSKVLFRVLEHDEFVTSFALKDANADTLMLRMSAYKNAIDSSQSTAEEFEKSLKWYQQNPSMFRIVLDSINKIVNKKRIERYQVKVDVVEEKKADSTNVNTPTENSYTPTNKTEALRKKFRTQSYDSLPKDPLLQTVQ